MLYLGIDLGSSSIKVSVFDAEKGKCVVSTQYPENELPINAPQAGWAEQDPEMWWENTQLAIKKAFQLGSVNPSNVKGIGISYQMHGLVLVDKNLDVLRPSIIWCDSRAVKIGDKAFREIGEDKCLRENLNSPGNFTASKLAWVKENEPEIYQQIYKFMLPGDYIAMKLSGECSTTATGLSEGIFWDYQKEEVSKTVLNHFQFSESLVPDIVPAIGEQVKVNKKAANETGIPEGTLISYRAGDQPNNAFSLNVLNPGELATTAGTSAVIYAITDKTNYDQQSRVNSFLHVNNTSDEKRNGVLACINGSGIYYQWIRKILGNNNNLPDYELLNSMSAKVNPGADGLYSYPFGNGAERILQNKEINASIHGLNLISHTPEHMVRAVKEGIVYAMNYGLEIMEAMQLKSKIVRAGKANLFLSPVFREIFVNTTNTVLELFETNGADGAARGAAVGTGFYSNTKEAFDKLECLDRLEPDTRLTERYKSLYSDWKENLKKYI
jgi:xylulokinase